MRELIGAAIPFLAILNPFALCLYLVGKMDELDTRSFRTVLLKASVLSLAVFALFAAAGDRLLVEVLGIHTEAMRIFGGVIFFAVGYGYATRGFQETVLLRGSLDDLPSEIAVPFMIGAGTITQSVLLGKSYSLGLALAVIVLSMALTVAAVVCFKVIRDRVKAAHEAVFDRYVNILSRLKGLLIGAISTDMVVTSLREMWLGS
ncbi:MAG: MarC family protein [Candidatus Brocadiia bacterium]